MAWFALQIVRIKVEIVALRLITLHSTKVIDNFVIDKFIESAA